MWKPPTPFGEWSGYYPSIIFPSGRWCFTIRCFMEDQSSSRDIMYATFEIYYLSRNHISHERIFIFSLQENPYATLTMTLAQTNFCKKHGFDPQSPLCAHIILSGTVTKVNETEMDIAKHSLFIRHPEMKTWPSSHNWFFAKLNITSIWVLDYFGGPKIVTPEEYYNVTVQWSRLWRI